METSTRLFGYPILGTGRVVMEFDESGWKVVEDSRSKGSAGGYLHLGNMEDGDVSADAVTDKVRDNIIKYMFYRNRIVFDNPKKLPALGATPQKRYFQGLSIEDLELIGNHGERAFYA